MFLNGDPIDEAISQGLSLSVDTWGAFASLVVDPINLKVTLAGQTVGVRDSSFAVGVDLRSQKQPAFSSTAANLSRTDTSGLIPEVRVPLSAELILDINVSDIILSPM